MRAPPPRAGLDVGGPVAAGRRAAARRGRAAAARPCPGSGRSEMSSPGKASWCIRVRMSPGSTAYVVSPVSAPKVCTRWSRAALAAPYGAPGLVVLDRGVGGDPHDHARRGASSGSDELDHQRARWRRRCPDRLAELGGGELAQRPHRQRAERAGVEHEEVEAAEVASTAATRAARWSASATSPTTAGRRPGPRSPTASCSRPAYRASVTTVHPRSVRARTSSSPSPSEPPVTRATGVGAVSGLSSFVMPAIVQVQVNLSSRRRRWRSTICCRWARSSSAAASRPRRSATTRPRAWCAPPVAGRAADVRAERAAPAGVHPGGREHRADAARDPRGARPAAGGTHPDQGGLEPDHAGTGAAGWTSRSQRWRSCATGSTRASAAAACRCNAAGSTTRTTCWRPTTAPGAARLPRLLRRPHPPAGRVVPDSDRVVANAGQRPWLATAAAAAAAASGSRYSPPATVGANASSRR